MCGIVGIIGKDHSVLEKMNGLQTHRGPNDAGVFLDRENGVGLAMRRLSILDLEGGHQPMPNHDGSLYIVFNGEIFNSPEIRRELEQKGYPFQTHNSDTECLLNLYSEKGETMLQDLNGMFAFVIYDKKKKRVFGARDRFGIKPFYFLESPSLFAFASELKSLLCLDVLQREVNLQSLYHYMTLGFVPGSDTIFAGVRRLKPAEAFFYDLTDRNVKIWNYWDLRFPEDGPATRKECLSYIREELKKAVQRWSLSDVPVACSLSGGLDSSSIVALLSENSAHKVKTYSLGFTDESAKDLDELPLARRVAEKYATEHHELTLEASDVLKDLVEMVWHLDEPYGGGLPSWYVFKFMAKDVKVGFTGTGGDELFGDYGKYIPMEGNRWKRLLGLSTSRFQPSLFEEKYMNTFYYMSDHAKRQLAFAPQAKAWQNTTEAMKAVIDRGPAANLRNSLVYLDFRTQLPEEFLFMTDRFSMAHSLEARVPFLDHVFVEKILRIPSAVRTKAGDLKYLLRESVAPLLPPELLRAQKRGFVLPTAAWLRGRLKDLARRLLQPDRLKEQGIFQPAYYQYLLQAHESGRVDNHKPLWFALMFQLWHTVFIEGDPLSKPTWSWEDVA